MKRFLVLLILFVTTQCFANIEIDKEDEVINYTVNKVRVDCVKIYPFSKSVVIDVREGYIENDEFKKVRMGNKLIWKNTQDNPETEEDETTAEYTDFINAVINKQVLKTAIINKRSK